MFCFASEKGVMHFNGCDTKYKELCPEDEINLLCLGVFVNAA